MFDDDAYRCKFKEILASMSPRKSRQMAGNAMHLGVVTYILMYLLSTLHIVPRSMATLKFHTSMSNMFEEEAGDAEEAEEKGRGIIIITRHGGAPCVSFTSSP